MDTRKTDLTPPPKDKKAEAPYNDTIWHYGFRALASEEDLKRGEEELREYRDYEHTPFQVMTAPEGQDYLGDYRMAPGQMVLVRHKENLHQPLTPEELALWIVQHFGGEDPFDPGPQTLGEYWEVFTQWVFALFFKMLAYPALWLNGVLAKRRKPPKERPPRVMRMVSVISQGGVAKVCLQSFLRMAPDRIKNYLLVFGEKANKNIAYVDPGQTEYLNRKLNLWPSSFRRNIFKSMFQTAKYVWRFNPDILHVHEPQFAPCVHLIGALTGGRRVCVHLHNDYNQRDRSVKPAFRTLTKKALQASHLIACSQYIHEKGAEYVGVPVSAIARIEDGNDDILPSQPDGRLVEELRQVAGDRLVVCMMANIMPHKRVDDFILACRILLDRGHRIFPLLMCYGKQKYARRLRVRFSSMFEPHEGEFLFRVKDAQHVAANVDIGVTTSALEGLGLNVLEYQDGEVPVVCTDLAPHKEMVVHNETGLLYPVGDIRALVEQLEHLIQNPDERKRLGEAGKKSADQRKWENTARETLAFYEQVLGSDRAES